MTAKGKMEELCPSIETELACAKLRSDKVTSALVRRGSPGMLRDRVPGSPNMCVASGHKRLCFDDSQEQVARGSLLDSWTKMPD